MRIMILAVLVSAASSALPAYASAPLDLNWDGRLPSSARISSSSLYRAIRLVEPPLAAAAAPRNGKAAEDAASAHCAGSGGQSNISYRQDGTKEVICAFERGAISAMTLYRAAALKQKTEAVETFFDRRVQLPEYDGSYNPAYKYCELAGGQPEQLKDESGRGAEVVCAFGDGSAIESWTLLRGPASETNRRLASVLRP